MFNDVFWRYVLLHCTLLITFKAGASRPRPLPYAPSHVTDSTTLATDEGTVPEDPYFTNGVQQVWLEDGTLLFEDSFGYMSRTYNVEMSTLNHFKVGSNSKLFTAVSIYQLYEQGLLDVNANVAGYLDQSDFEKFGFPNQTTWCPTIYEGDGNCEPITFVQLMSMR